MRKIEFDYKVINALEVISDLRMPEFDEFEGNSCRIMPDVDP
jgi:hypothetical protein